MSDLIKLMKRQQPISPEQRTDLYLMITFLKLAADYAAVLRKGANIKFESKQIFGDVSTFANNSVGRIHAGISTEDGKAVFTEAWQHDYHVWAHIIRYMAAMNPQQLDAVETFCEQLLNGNVQFEASEKVVS